jgi:large subunit ribosomal protein L31
MKEGIHPNYREVCFLDLSNGFKFVTRSCVNAKEMVKMDDGRELPLFKLDTSSESHPFYTGTQKSVDNMGGRVERFRNRFGKTSITKESSLREHRRAVRATGLPLFFGLAPLCDFFPEFDPDSAIV